MAFFHMLWSRYQQSLLQRPYLTNAATGSTIAIFGDVMAQTKFKDWSGEARQTRSGLSSSSALVITSSSTNGGTPRDPAVIDLRRSLIFASFTMCFGTPFWLRVYKVLDRMVPHVTPVTAIKKGMISWVVANSTTPLFIAYVTTMDRLFIKKHHGASNGDGVVAVWAKIRRDLPVMMSYSICFWSIQWIPMFYLLPPHFRLVYVSFLQIVWSGITSYLLHRSHPEEQVGGASL